MTKSMPFLVSKASLLCSVLGRNLSSDQSNTHVIVGPGLLTSYLPSTLAVKHGLPESFMTNTVTSDKQALDFITSLTAVALLSQLQFVATCHVYTSLQQHSAYCMAHCLAICRQQHCG